MMQHENMLELYFQPFIFAIVLSCILTILFVMLHKSRKRAKRKEGQKVAQAYFRFGGVAIGITFLCILFFDTHLQITFDLWGLVFGVVAVVLFGLWDDVLELNWKRQITFQVALASAMFFLFNVRIDIQSIEILQSFSFSTTTVFIIGCILTITWFMALINSLNWLDGMDGLSGGVIALAGIFLFLLSLKPEVNQPPVGIIALVVSGAYLGFLIFNIYPAKIISGTVGTYLGGFILAYLSIYAGAKVATALLILSLPLLDAFWVIWRRMRDGVSIFQGDTQRHLHYTLQSQGWHVYSITVLFYVLTGIFGLIALYTKELGKGLALILVSIVLVGLLVFFHKKKKELS